MNREPKGEIVIYRTKDGKTTLEVNLVEETVWLTQLQLSELFSKDRRTISEHINNIFKEKELQRDRTIRKFRIVQQHVFNQVVKRNSERFSDDSMIKLTHDEVKRISQFVTSSELQFSKNETFALTFEEYVSKLWDSSPLLMKKAIDESMDVKNWILRIYMLSIGYPY